MKSMSTQNLLIALLGLLVVLGVIFYVAPFQPSPSGVACTMEAKLCPDGSYVGRTGPNCEFTACPSAPSDYKNATYIIEGLPVTLVNGRAEVADVPDSALKMVTQYFGNEATGDLNGDGTPDVAFILTQNGGGSGTFYHAVVALKAASGYQGTNAILLGDRIAPQTTEIRNGQVIVNYADRKAGEPMSVRPSV